MMMMMMMNPRKGKDDCASANKQTQALQSDSMKDQICIVDLPQQYATT